MTLPSPRARISCFTHSSSHASDRNADIEQRKRDHIDIVLSGSARHSESGGFDDIRFVHNALPELNFHEIDLSSTFLNHRLEIPYLASSMTGGPEAAARINNSIAEAAQTMGFAMAVGSQRIALTTGYDHGVSAELRRRAPNILLFANLGAVQLVNGMDVEHARRAVDSIEANALILHLNPLQEALQDQGDRNWKGIEVAIADLTRQLSVPVIAKEVGAGISVNVARRLIDCGVMAIDVAGAGGTSWAAVEGKRASAEGDQALGEIFRDWGLPTTYCLSSISSAFPGLPLIASGGIRHGLDAAKAIRLGANLVGQAGALLPAAVKGTEAVIDHVTTWAKALRAACFATGSSDLASLRNAPLHP